MEYDDQGLMKKESMIINGILQMYMQLHFNLSRVHKLYTIQKLLKYSDAKTF
jgi:hypothetical protein